MNSMLTFIENTTEGRALYICKCGNHFDTWRTNVKNGRVYSCGCINRRRKNKLSKLLEDSLESYYWLGFLLADGHFTDLGRLVLGLSIVDKGHLDRFNDFLGNVGIVRSTDKKCVLAVNDIDTVSKLKETYGIVSNKTVSPPKLIDLPEDKKRALYIGFIDGDGSIQYQSKRKDCRITIKLHNSWLEWLSDIMGVQCKINSQGYAYGCAASVEYLRDLKNFVIENNLPVLARKWDKIDISYVSRTEIALERTSQVLQLFNSGKRVIDIANELNLKYSTVYQIIQRKG